MNTATNNTEEPYIAIREALEKLRVKFPNLTARNIRKAINHPDKKLPCQRSSADPAAKINVRVSDVEAYFTSL